MPGQVAAGEMGMIEPQQMVRAIHLLSVRPFVDAGQMAKVLRWAEYGSRPVGDRAACQ
jgi:hypothetical protein